MTRWTWVAILLSLIWLLTIPFIGISEYSDFVFWQLRVPRVLMGVMVGAVLGLTGAVFQTLFNNPLATPATTGTTAAATLGALIGIVLIGSQTVMAVPVIILSAFSLSLVASLLVARIASMGQVRIEQILLAGIAVSLAAGSIASGVQFNADQASTFQAIRWSLGNLGQVGYTRVLYMLPLFLLCMIILLKPVRALEAYLFGESRAWTHGVNVVRLRTVLLIVGSVGVGASVALCGPIAFVGLIVPHIVRLMVASERRILLPLSAWYGGVFLASCDLFCRLVYPGRELPVGVMTAAIGAPVLIWLIIRRSR